MGSRPHTFAVDYTVFGSPKMQRGEFVLYTTSPTDAELTAHIENAAGYSEGYVKVYHSTLMHEPRSSYNRRL